MAQSRTPQPQIDQESAKELNLAVLQRMDANVEDILATAGHVTLYEFDVEEKQWVSVKNLYINCERICEKRFVRLCHGAS